MAERTTSAPRIKIKDMVFIAMSAVFIAICSWISIPTVVPFTLQTFAVFLVLGVFGGKRGTFAALIYMLLGAVGLPVFAGFKSGIGALLGTTGGYILGFLLAGIVYMIAERLAPKNNAKAAFVVKVIGLVIGLAVCYAFGTAWFMIVYARANGAIPLATALGWCVIPFIIPDLIKLVVAVAITPLLKKVAKLDEE